MAQTCDICGTVVYRRIYDTAEKKDVGVDCGCRRHEIIQRSTVNPFDIRFDHVADEFGNHLEVHSIRELERAEKRLGFQSVVLNSDAQNFDDPPTQQKIDMASVHNWKFGGPRRGR